MYPYQGQEDAKLGWLANETPNPLETYNQDHVFVGYPISISVHGSETREIDPAEITVEAMTWKSSRLL